MTRGHAPTPPVRWEEGTCFNRASSAAACDGFDRLPQKHGEGQTLPKRNGLVLICCGLRSLIVLLHWTVWPDSLGRGIAFQLIPRCFRVSESQNSHGV
jgi:hypothetical protein